MAVVVEEPAKGALVSILISGGRWFEMPVRCGVMKKLSTEKNVEIDEPDHKGLILMTKSRRSTVRW